MKFRKDILVLIFTILYVIIFGIYYLIIKNYEFMIYIAVIVFLIVIMVFLHKKYNFSPGILLGTSIWGLMHMAGGSIKINGSVLYAFKIIPIWVTDNFYVFKFDQFAHFYCYIFATLIVFYILKKDINNKNKTAISLIILFAGMGIGALNEMIEFSAVLFLSSTGVGDYFNNMWDLMFNALGALTAVVYLNVKGKI